MSNFKIIKQETVVSQADIRDYLNRSKQRLDIILSSLQWSKDGIVKQHGGQQPMAEHDLLPQCLEKNMHCIQLSAECIENLTAQATADEAPATFNDLQIKYDAQQKLSIYEYAIRCTMKPHEELILKDDSNFVAMVDNTKRKQKKTRRYRKSKPTLNEELHQVIELQMQALEQQYKELAATARAEQSPVSKDRETLKREVRQSNKQQKHTHAKKRRSHSPHGKRYRERSRSRSHIHKRQRTRSRSPSRNRPRGSTTHSSCTPFHAELPNRHHRKYRHSRSRDRHQHYSSSRSPQHSTSNKYR